LNAVKESRAPCVQYGIYTIHSLKSFFFNIFSSSAYFAAGSSTSSYKVRSSLSSAQAKKDLSSLGISEITFQETKQNDEESEGTSPFVYVLIAVGVVAGVVLCVVVVTKVSWVIFG
jgi:hypothetical protein